MNHLYCNETEQPKKVSIQLKWYHQFQFAGYYMAKEKGFYQDAGLDVTILEGGPDIAVQEVVSTGGAEFGVLGSELVLFKAQGYDVVVLAPIMQHSIRAIIAKSDIGSLHNLAGAKIMLNKNEMAEFEAMFMNEGIDKEKITIINKDSSANVKFINREIDALNGSIANQPFLFDQAGISIFLIRPINYGIDFYGDTLFTRSECITNDPEKVTSFQEASIKGWDYAFKHPDETIDIIMEKYGSSKSREHLYFEYRQLKKLILPELVELGHNNPKRWEHIGDTYIKLGLLDPDFSFEGFIYEPEEERARLINTLLISFMILAGIALIVIGIVVIFNRRLTSIVHNKTDQLKKANNYISNIINSINSILIGIDQDGIITLWNWAAADATNISSENAIGKPLTHIFPILKEDMIIIREAIQKRSKPKTTLHKRQKGKETIHEEISVYPLIANGVDGAVVRIDDVTERTRLHEQMIQNEKMISVSGLAAGMAHEINNPLAGVMQTAFVIEKRLINLNGIRANENAAHQAGVSLENIQKYMEIRQIPIMVEGIKKSCSRLSSIVNNMLSFSRKVGNNKIPCDIPRLVEDTIELGNIDFNLKKNYDFKQIKIIKEYEPELPPVPCERSKIQQVLFNILRNGAQAMSEANIKDPTFSIRIGIEKNAERLCIEIEDNGPGMDEDTQKHIFEPFFTTKDKGGVGLGLSVSYFIITEDHGGEISVLSREDQGALFIIRLPLK